MGVSLLPSFKGTYQLVPPPGARVGGFGFKSIKRGFKKAGRGIKKVGKKGYKVGKKGVKAAAKVTKFAARAIAKLAAKPIIYAVNRLAKRRARYVAFKRTGSTATTKADRKAGAQYALSKVASKGPIGKLAVKILRYTGGVTAGGDLLGYIPKDVSGWRQDAAMCGMTGPEIAAMSTSIIAAVTQLTKALNKKGEAPANPAAAEEAEEPAAEESEEPAAEETEEGEDETSGDLRSLIRRLKMRKRLRRAGVAVPLKTARRGRGHF